LYWAKNAAPLARNHRAGFGPIALTATSQRWIVPTSSTALRNALRLDGNRMLTSFTSADLPEVEEDLLPVTIGLNAKNLVILGDASGETGTNAARGRTLDSSSFSANGLFTATFTLQDSRKVSVSGAFLQQPSVVPGTVIGEGYFVVPPTVRGEENVQGNIQFLAP
jgi:hypothetical protein